MRGILPVCNVAERLKALEEASVANLATDAAQDEAIAGSLKDITLIDNGDNIEISSTYNDGTVEQEGEVERPELNIAGTPAD